MNAIPVFVITFFQFNKTNAAFHGLIIGSTLIRIRSIIIIVAHIAPLRAIVIISVILKIKFPLIVARARCRSTIRAVIVSHLSSAPGSNDEEPKCVEERKQCHSCEANAVEPHLHDSLNCIKFFSDAHLTAVHLNHRIMTVIILATARNEKANNNRGQGHIRTFHVRIKCFQYHRPRFCHRTD